MGRLRRCTCEPQVNAFDPECPTHGERECDLDWCTEPAADGEVLCDEHVELELYERESEATADL